MGILKENQFTALLCCSVYFLNLWFPSYPWVFDSLNNAIPFDLVLDSLSGGEKTGAAIVNKLCGVRLDVYLVLCISCIAAYV